MDLTRVLVLCGVGAALQAAPITVTSTSTVFLEFNGFYASSQILIPGLTGQVSLSNFSFTPEVLSGKTVTRVSMDYSIVNNAATPILTSRITNFAFDTTPTIMNSQLNQVSGVFGSIAVDANQPNGIGTVEVCFTAANCPGGGSGGVAKGGTGGGVATIYYGGLVNSFTLDNAYLRYQSISCADGSPCSGSASGVPAAGGDVPEPGTWAMLTLGLAGIGIASRMARRG